MYRTYPDGLFEETHGPITPTSRPLFGGDIPTYQWARDHFAIEVNKRSGDNDIVLSTFGDSFGGDTFRDCIPPVVESAIGYPYAHHAHYKIFESHYIRNYVKGLNKDERANYSESVIHGYIDPEEYIFNTKPQDYFLYLARVEDDYAESKGLHLALQLQDALKFKLKIAGPGPGEKYVRDGVDYVGPVAQEEKAKLISNAKALFSMTLYPEPFGYIVIESFMSGTPVISSDHGAFPETIPSNVGFRGVFWTDYVNAIKNIDNIDRYECRDHAMRNFSLESAYKKYVKFFEKIIYHHQRGWYG